LYRNTIFTINMTLIRINGKSKKKVESKTLGLVTKMAVGPSAPPMVPGCDAEASLIDS
jgi:hypothetical protein